VASPAYVHKHGKPKTPADLAAHACIGYSYASSGDQWNFTDPKGRVHSVKVSCALHANNGDTVRAATLAGLGVSNNPGFLIGPDLQQGTLVELLPDYRLPDIDILAMYPSRRHLSAKVRVMIDFLAQAFAGTAPWDRQILRSTRK
jgi:DNA-binding transcriptional LysR family regulator